MSGWTLAWLGFVGYFVAVEGLALWTNWRSGQHEGKSRRTLSAHLWAWLGFARGTRPGVWGWVRRGAALVALVWLAGHVLGGGTWWWWEA